MTLTSIVHPVTASSGSSSGAHSASTNKELQDEDDPQTPPPQEATSFNDLEGQFETPTPTHTPDSPHSMSSSIDEWSKQLDELDKLRNSDLVLNEAGEAEEGDACDSKADSDCFPPPPPPLQLPNREYLLPPGQGRGRPRIPLGARIHKPIDTSDLTDELSAAMEELSAIGGLTAITGITDVEERRARMPTNDTMSCPDETDSHLMTAEMHLQEVEEQLQNIFTPTPMELFKVTLHKLREHEDFGFSLSDGVYEKGVYLSAIRPGGPADRSGVLRLFDRVLQVGPLWLITLNYSWYFLVPESSQRIESGSLWFF